MASMPNKEMDPKKEVVITRMGLSSIFGNNVNTFYNKMLEGTSGIDIIDRVDISKFPTKFAR
jgi:3-oxoacyl-[acyl-carrier-protein] synthase II